MNAKRTYPMLSKHNMTSPYDNDPSEKRKELEDEELEWAFDLPTYIDTDEETDES